MRWEDERYVRSYTRDTPGWVMLPWQAKALQKLLERKLDRAGVLDLAEYASAQMVEVIAAMVGLPEEVVAVGMPALLKRKTFVLHGQHLVMPNFLEAQECHASPNARMRAFRERQRAVDRAIALGVTPRDSAQHGVTNGSAEQRSVAPANERARETNSLSHGVTDGDDPFALPPGESDDDIPDDLGQIPGPVTPRDRTLTRRDGVQRTVANGDDSDGAGDSVPSRALPSRAVPSPNTQHSSPSKKPDEADRIETEIRRHRVFDPLDARGVAEAHAGRMMTDSQRIGDVIDAIAQCAAKSVGLGLTGEALQSKLVGFLWKAGKHHGGSVRAGTAPAAPPAAPEEFDFSQYKNLHSGRRQP